MATLSHTHSFAPLEIAKPSFLFPGTTHKCLLTQLDMTKFLFHDVVVVVVFSLVLLLVCVVAAVVVAAAPAVAAAAAAVGAVGGGHLAAEGAKLGLHRQHALAEVVGSL